MLLGWLAIAFVVLKLTHYIDWSWWWVLAPLWVAPTVGLILLVGFFLIVLIAEAFE